MVSTRGWEVLDAHRCLSFLDPRGESMSKVEELTVSAGIHTPFVKLLLPEMRRNPPEVPEMVFAVCCLVNPLNIVGINFLGRRRSLSITMGCTALFFLLLNICTSRYFLSACLLQNSPVLMGSSSLGVRVKSLSPGEERMGCLFA